MELNYGKFIPYILDNRLLLKILLGNRCAALAVGLIPKHLLKLLVLDGWDGKGATVHFTSFFLCFFLQTDEKVFMV